MKILVLEDDDKKFGEMAEVLVRASPDAEIIRSRVFQCFLKNTAGQKFDLIVVDLLAPQFDISGEAVDLTEQILDAVRLHDTKNFRTPVIAVTRYDEKAGENFRSLNMADVTIITYDVGRKWCDSLIEKTQSSIPQQSYPFVIVCALYKELDGFKEADCELGETRVVNGLECREITIKDNKGLLVVCQRMGLVNASITASLAIELFRPKLICMSGICAGIDKKANIYDVIIPEICHQHDFGKWTSTGFEPEPYSVQIPQELLLKVRAKIMDPNFASGIAGGLSLDKDEFPPNANKFSFEIKMAPASSGSAVVAHEDMVEVIKNQHRKMTAFEMESFAVYEAARLSRHQPMYFSAKCVVDDGGAGKGDSFHRVACILSARTVCKLIADGVCNFAH